MSELPINWVSGKLGELGVWRGGGTPSKRNPSFWEGGTIPWVSPKDMKFVSIDDTQDHITESAVKGSATKILPKDSLLVVTRSGILQHSLPVATNSREVTLNQDLKALIPIDGLDVKYLYYAFRRFERDILHACCKAGTTVQSIEFPRLKDFEIPIAPLSEQRRIVARIEEIFSRLDAGVAALRHAKAQLQRYRQSVLAAAVTGQLTQAWREQHPDTEPAEELLERILEQRREQWNGKGKYQEPKEPKVERTDGSPKTWACATVDQVGDVFLGKMLDKSKHTEGQKLPYLRNINIRWGRVDVSDLSEMHYKDTELERYGLRKGDLLVCEGGEPGRAAVWDNSLPELKYQKALHRVRFRIGVDPRFVLFCLERDAKAGRLEQRFTGSTIKHFTRQAFIGYEISLPPFAEQHQIVAEVETRVTAIDHLEAELDRQITRSNRLRQSTLAFAFSGCL